MFTQHRPRWYRPDAGLAMRMLVTMFLLGAVYVVFIVVVASVFRVDFSFLIVLALVLAGAQYFFADKIALLAMGAREVSESEAPRPAQYDQSACYADEPAQTARGHRQQ